MSILILPKIFIAYAREDAPLLEKLRKPLNVLRRNGHCNIFFDGEIVPGEHWDKRLKDELYQADIFILLVTDNFLDSDYINDVELPKALEKENSGKAKVVPIIMRPCMWQYTLLKNFQVVLNNGNPIEISDGYVFAVEQIARVIKQRKQEANEPILKRYNSLCSAIRRIEKSIRNDENDIEFRTRKINSSDESLGQLERELIKAVIRMIEERKNKKKGRIEELTVLKAEIEEQLGLQT